MNKPVRTHHKEAWCSECALSFQSFHRCDKYCSKECRKNAKDKREKLRYLTGGRR